MLATKKLDREITISLTPEQARLVETALRHYTNLLDRIEETAEQLDQAGFSDFYTSGEDKRYRSERLNLGILNRKLTA